MNEHAKDPVDLEVLILKKKHTRMFFQRPLSFKQAAQWVFIHYMIIGIIKGYYQALIFNLESLGASFKSMSTLEIALQPYSWKFVICPFLDRFYLHKVGRSKTFICGGGFILGCLFYFLRSRISKMAHQIEVVPITIVFLVIHSLVCLVQVSGES